MSSRKLIVRNTIIDPARAKELINPEFVADGAFLVTSNDRGSLGYRYDALPAAVAAEPTAFGCIVCEVEGDDRSSALVAMLWDGVVTRLHFVSPVDGGGETVAKPAAVANDADASRVIACGTCDLRADAPQVASCTRTDCPLAAREMQEAA